MEQKRSKSLILSSSEVKSRRLKMLQTIEARRLELTNRQLSRAEGKALRQLDFQRTEFRRRLSDVSAQLGTDFLSDNNGSSSFAQSRESSPGHVSRPQMPRLVRSLSRAGHAFERSMHQQRMHKTSLDNSYGLQDADADGNIAEIRPPFWLRIPSLGIPTDEANIAAGLESLETTSKINQNLSPSAIATEESDSSPAGKSDTSGVADRFTFSTTDTKSSSTVGGVQSPKGTTDMRPLWLKALKKLREQRFARLNGQQAEECEQLAALVTGCSFSSPLFANSPKPSGAKSTGVGTGIR